MIAKFPFLSYCVMFGVKYSTVLEKPVLTTFSIVRLSIEEESKPRDGGPFMAIFSSMGPVVLSFGDLANHTHAIPSRTKCVAAFKHLPVDDERCLYLSRLLSEIKQYGVNSSHGNVWFRRFAYIVKFCSTWKNKMPIPAEHVPVSYYQDSDQGAYFPVMNHIAGQ